MLVEFIKRKYSDFCRLITSFLPNFLLFLQKILRRQKNANKIVVFHGLFSKFAIRKLDITMVLSMTGFGRGIATSTAKKVTIEIKSLNSKQLDLSMRVPQYFREKEVEMRNKIAEHLLRGKVEVAVMIETVAAEVNASINVGVLKGYKEQIINMAQELQIDTPSDWYATLLRLPDALKTESAQVGEEETAALWSALEQAIENIIAFRKQEGQKLDQFFREKIANIRTLLKAVEPFEEERVTKIRTRLEENLAKLGPIDYDKNRLEQELIYYIEKLDVNEEKLRLDNHMNYFIETLDGELGQGKKLGFIAQEMGREINTLGSKSNNAEMQRIVVRMKDELEQIKEQVLNVL